MWITIGIVIGLVVGSWFGYQFCMAKYRPAFLLKVMKLQNKHIVGNLTTEDFVKELAELKKENPDIKLGE